ncbi:hypothetical protein PInf_016368 [Phytophthora infestans]|nr:hypothetical protein PInf_016368 [Phytophthora infestans]
MDLALSVVEGLRQIYSLQDAIRRQRRVNRKTYLRMMEIYVELQMSEPIQDNPTLKRTTAIQKFSDAVANFSHYLQKHHDMSRVVRILKFASMEEQRQKIVDEVDELFRMLNLAANVAVINGQTAASVNATRLLAKLEAMHGDIRLTHDKILAALVANKQQIEITKMKVLAKQEPSVANPTADKTAKKRIDQEENTSPNEVKTSHVVTDVKENLEEEKATADDEFKSVTEREELREPNETEVAFEETTSTTTISEVGQSIVNAHELVIVKTSYNDLEQNCNDAPTSQPAMAMTHINCLLRLTFESPSLDSRRPPPLRSSPRDSFLVAVPLRRALTCRQIW